MSSSEEQVAEQPQFESVPLSGSVERTPSEIERAARSIREWMSRIRENNNNSPDHQEQQTIQLDPEWLDSITKTVNDFGRSVILACGQPPTIYQPSTISRFFGYEGYVGRSEPIVLYIGPYHYEYRDGESYMEDYKWCCVHRLIERHRNHDGSNESRKLLDTCLMDMKTLEGKVKSCYAGNIKMESNELALRMMLDGCFILHLLLKEDNTINYFQELQDSLVRQNLWIWQIARYDLLLPDNQIPLFIVEKLFDRLRTPADANVNLVSQAFWLLKDLLPHRMDTPRFIPSHQVHHLLHLFYLSIVPLELTIEQPTPSSLKANWIPCVRELQDAGVKFEKRTSASSFLDIKFSDGVMYIPPLEIHDYSNLIFGNLIAFEQSYPDTQCHVTNYAVFMDCLINTPYDVRVLHLKGILIDRTGVEQGTVVFFRRLCRGIHYASDKNYLSSVFSDVTKYQESTWHKWRAGLARDYFNSPWTSISVAAAVVLLILSFIQTFFTVYPYFKPKH